MKLIRIIVLLAFLATQLRVHAQDFKPKYLRYNLLKGDTINRVDMKGRRQGKWMKFYDNDQPYYVGYFVNALPRGEFKYYARDGKLQAINRITPRGDESYYIDFYEDGTKRAVGKFVNEKKDSVWLYFDYTGKLRREEAYHLDKKNGAWKLYYENGNLVEVTTWKEGKKSGPWQRFYSNGKARVEGVYKDANFDGPVAAFYMSGHPWIKGQYKNGLRDGEWIYYKEDPAGAEEYRDRYKNGVQTTPPRPDDVIREEEIKQKKKEAELDADKSKNIGDDY